MTEFTVVNHANEAVRVEDSRAAAEKRKEAGVNDLGISEEDIDVVQGAYESYDSAVQAKEVNDVTREKGREQMQADGGNTEVVENATPVQEPATPDDSNALDQLGDTITEDPLDVLPGYMITTMEGKPTLNKRGVSVLAFHYDVSVVGHEVTAHPHETEYEYCSIRFTVERDGKEYVGHGEAHADEVDKSKLLRMAETRAYKRSVIFATGTGIVGYQEIMNEL